MLDSLSPISGGRIEGPHSLGFSNMVWVEQEDIYARFLSGGERGIGTKNRRDASPMDQKLRMWFRRVLCPVRVGCGAVAQSLSLNEDPYEPLSL
jgi:hypothetical protein